MSRLTSIAALSLVVVLTIPITVMAQPATSFDDLTKRLKPGATVTVTDTTGREVTGRLQDLSPSSLVLLVGEDAQRLTLGEPSVSKVTSGSSRALGMLIGLGIGGVAGFLFGQAGTHDDCEGVVFDACSFVGLLGGAGIGAAVGAVAGGPKTLYQAPGQASRLRLSPMLSRTPVASVSRFGSESTQKH